MDYPVIIFCENEKVVVETIGPFWTVFLKLFFVETQD
jgi:hypothetical protein